MTLIIQLHIQNNLLFNKKHITILGWVYLYSFDGLYLFILINTVQIKLRAITLLSFFTQRYFFLNDRWLAVEEDDGMVERIIPVAGIEDLVAFKQLFSSSVKKKITNEHLWFSVFSRPTRSNFTRVQRISCCMSLLFLTMITNCMWFKTTDSNDNVTALTMGPFTFTLQQVSTHLVVFWN